MLSICTKFSNLHTHIRIFTLLNFRFFFQKPKSALKVLQLSDVHLDPNYAENTVANCEEPLCCRPYSTPSPTQPVILSGRSVVLNLNQLYSAYARHYASNKNLIKSKQTNICYTVYPKSPGSIRYVFMI